MAKVLLVEDDNNLREIYEARMQAEGYDVISAKDGEEALVVAKAQKPDLIVSDVMMPKISGFEMLDILRNTEGLKDVKVIMLTALGQADDQQRADRLGADRYLVKSQVTLEDIVNVAHELLADAVAPEPAAPAEPAAATPVMPVAVAPTPVPAPVAAPEPAPVAAPAVAVAPAPPVATDATAQPTLPSTPPVAPVAPPASFAAVQVPPAGIVTPDPTPATVPPAPASPLNPVAQTTAQEEAAVEAQIEDFVSGASSEAPANPSVVPPATATTDAASTLAAANSAADDQIMADAVNTLVSSTVTSETPAPEISPAVTQPAPITISVAPTLPPIDEPAPAPQTTPPVESAVAANNPTNSVGGNRVIAPIENGAAKPNLDTLLAMEDAKQILATPPAGEAPVSAPQQAATPTPAPASPTTKVDPNSISL